ncbi:MAG: hypothetical protein E7676_04390 [Ruminococcaceae bacterium]|nr:hypothetical protein [Oscillospiraceae bacterium]
MKRLILLVSVLVFILTLVSCDPATHLLNAEALLANTTKIELVNYENENPKMIRNIEGDKKPTFDFSKVSLIATLDDSKIEDVVKDVSDRGYLYYASALNEPIGKTLILYQSNGNMVVLSNCVYTDDTGDTKYYGDCCIYDANGVFIECIGRVGNNYIDSLESQYFNIDK